MKYIAGLAALLAVVFAAACTATDNVAETQTNNILSYLEKLPRAEGDNPLRLGDSLYITTDGIYKYVAVVNLDESAPLVQTGDELSIWFSIRELTTTPATEPIYTNIRELMGEDNTTDWPTLPKQIVVGNGDIIKSIDNALPLCQYDSKVVFIIPSAQLFDDQAAGLVQANTALMYEITIIKKQ